MPRQPRQPYTPAQQAQQAPCNAHQQPGHMHQQHGYMTQQPLPNPPYYMGNGYSAQIGYPIQYPQYPPQHLPQYPQYPQHQMHPQHQQQLNPPCVQPVPGAHVPAVNIGGVNPGMHAVPVVQEQYVDVKQGYRVLQGRAGREVAGAVLMPLQRPLSQAEDDMIWRAVADVLRKRDERKAGKQRAVEPVEDPTSSSGDSSPD